MGIVAAAAAVLLCITAVLFIPLTYHIRIYAGTPFRIAVCASWFGRALRYTWDYTYGQRPDSSCYLAWKRQEKHADIPEETAEQAAVQAEEAIKKALEEDNPETYEALKQAKVPASSSFHWKPLVLNTSFAESFFRWLGQLAYHSRIRTLDISGTIGLPQPHETGLLAGALYAIVPDAVGNLRFNYTEEQYDSTICGGGTIYPAIILFYSAAFILSRPVRRFIACWHASKRGEHHG